MCFLPVTQRIALSGHSEEPVVVTGPEPSVTSEAGSYLRLSELVTEKWAVDFT